VRRRRPGFDQLASGGENLGLAADVLPFGVADVGAADQGVLAVLGVVHDLVLDDVVAASVHMVDHRDALLAVLVHVAVHRLAAAGVDIFFGEARFTGPDTLTVDGVEVHFRKALIATGARPNFSAFPGLEEIGYLTNENVFDLSELPRRLLVIGGGPLGCELAQAFCRLGSQTTIVEEKPLFLGGEERDAAQILSDSFANDGIKVRLNTRAVAARTTPRRGPSAPAPRG